MIGGRKRDTYKSEEAGSSITSMSDMTFGWWINFIMAISLRTAFSMAGFAARCALLMIFIATCSPVCLWTPNLTRPNYNKIKISCPCVPEFMLLYLKRLFPASFLLHSLQCISWAFAAENALKLHQSYDVCLAWIWMICWTNDLRRLLLMLFGNWGWISDIPE